MSMKKKVLYITICCAALFIAGMIAFRPDNDSEKTSAFSTDGNGYKQEYYEHSDNAGVGSIFDEKYYSYYVNENDQNIAYLERIVESDSIPQEQLFTANDVNRIMSSLLKTEYEVETTRIESPASSDKIPEGAKAVENILVYDEIKNGYPTGTSMGIVLDNEGYISHLTLRKGTAYDADASTFVDKKEAFDKAVEATKEKYKDKNLEFNAKYSEDKISVYYNPAKGLCYTFEFEGAIDGKWNDELSIFEFYPSINVYDVNDIEIASSFCY